jgi:HemY protein
MRTKAIAAILVAVIVPAGVWAFLQRQRSAAAARLPPPPVSQSKAVAAHLAAQYESARNDPSSPAAIGLLCVAYHADMFFAEADRCYGLAIELDANQWRWQYYRALIQAERGGGETLIESLRGVVAKAPQFTPAWLRLGDAYFKARNYDEASQAWGRVVAASASQDAPAATPALSERSESNGPRHVPELPLAAYANVGLARIALVKGETARAKEILERVAADAPHFSSALRLLADVYRGLGRQADADRFVYRANRLQPYAPYADPMVDDLARETRNSTVLLRLSSEANLAINAEWAEYLMRRALEYDPDNPEVVVKLGRILRTVGRNDEALAFFQRYHEMVPGDFLGLAHIGSCLSAMGRLDEAEGYLRRAVAGIDDPQTHYNLGLLLALTNRLGEAVTEYQKALARDPMHADARLNLGTAFARQGRMDLAARELTRLVDEDPDNAPARTNLGVVFIQQGKIAQARVQLEAALRSDPNLGPARQALESIGR